jgi:hypothetical protein
MAYFGARDIRSAVRANPHSANFSDGLKKNSIIHCAQNTHTNHQQQGWITCGNPFFYAVVFEKDFDT